MIKNLAVISSGGGFKCAFGAGVMKSLAKGYNLAPETLICGSGSAGTGTYWVGKHYEEVEEVWTNRLSSAEMITKGIFPKININHLIDKIFKKDFPFDEKKVKNSETEYFISALNRNTGFIEYFSNKSNVDLYEAMRATKSLPIFSEWDPKIKLNGSEYCDSFLSSGTDSHYHFAAKEKNAKKIIVIDNAPKNTEKKIINSFFNTWIFFKEFKENYYKLEEKLLNFKFPKENVFEINPKTPLKINSLENNKQKLKDTFKQGYNETKSNKKLQEFLKEIS